MDSEHEGESQRAARLRARRASSESAGTATPKKSSRQPKLKSITEKETKPKKKKEKKHDDDDDASSVSTEQSLRSMQSCKVVLKSMNLGEEEEKMLSSVPKTRSRKKSTLTEENLAAHSSVPARRTTRRAVSNATDETTSTKASTLPRRNTRRSSVAASVAPATTTPKRNTRAASHSSDNRQNSPTSSQTPTATKKKGKSRLVNRLDSSESDDELLSQKKYVKKSAVAEEMVQPKPQQEPEIPAQPLVPIAEDVFHTPTGPDDVICIEDSDEEGASTTPAPKSVETTEKPIPTIATTIAVTPSELSSLVQNSEEAANNTLNAKSRLSSRPSISKWPRSKLREEEEQPMDLSETIDEDNISMNKSYDTFSRITEIMASAAVITGVNLSQADASSDVSSAAANTSVIVEPTEKQKEPETLVEAKRMSIHEAVTPAKTASPLKKTAQLIKATMLSEQAESPKSKRRTLSKSIDMEQKEDDQNADGVSEAPSSAGESPKISPSKLTNAIVDRIAPSPKKALESSTKSPAVEVDTDMVAISREKIPEPSTAVPNVTDASLTQETFASSPHTADGVNSIDKEKSPAPSQDMAVSIAANVLIKVENVELVSDEVENQSNASTDNVQFEAEEATVEMPKSLSPEVGHILTPKSVKEVRGAQTPKSAAKETVSQSPKVTQSVDAPVAQASKTPVMVRTAVVEQENQTPKTPVVVRAPVVEQVTQTPNMPAVVRAAVVEQVTQTPKTVVEIRATVAEHETQTPKTPVVTRTAVIDHETQTPKTVVEVRTAVAEHETQTPKTVAEVRAAVAEHETQTPKTPVVARPAVVEHVTQTPKKVVEVRTVVAEHKTHTSNTPAVVRAAVVEHETQTPKTVVEVRAVQTPKTIVEEHATQTPEPIKPTRSVQIEEVDVQVKQAGNASTPQPVAEQPLKRRDTPYPDKSVLQNDSFVDAMSNAVASELNDHLRKSREKLRTLSSSWTESVKRNSIDAPYIDGFGVQNKSSAGAVDEATPKKFITARNRLEDSDSDQEGEENDEDMEVAEDGEDGEDVEAEDEEVEEAEKLKNSFIDAEAFEAATDYESGDSMDSEERREMEDNEISEHGISLGSQDSDREGEEDDDDDLASFIASDTESDVDEYDKLVAKPKYKRISRLPGSDDDSKSATKSKYKRISQQLSSDDEDSDDDAANVKNKSLVDVILNGSKKAATDTAAVTIAAEEVAANTVADKNQSENVAMGAHPSVQDVITDTQNEKVAMDTRPPVEIAVTEAATIETIESTVTTRRSIQATNDDFVESETLKRNLDVDEGGNKSANKSGFVETERSPPGSIGNKSLSTSRVLDASMVFTEEDAVLDNDAGPNKSVGKVAAEFEETENAPTPENASKASEEVEVTENGSNDSDEGGDEDDEDDEDDDDDADDAEIHYSLNKSHPKIVKIVATALLNASTPLLDSELTTSSDEETEESAPKNKTVVDTTANKSVTDKPMVTAKAIEKEPSGGCDDDNAFYKLNEEHPTNAKLLCGAQASSRNLDQTKEHSNSDEQIVPSVLNSSSKKSMKANTSLPLVLMPREGKENVSTNQMSAVVKLVTNRSLQGDENASPSPAFKTFLKKSGNKLLNAIDTNQTLHVNPLSTHFDANASNLRRSSTPNEKTLLKTQAATAQIKVNQRSNESMSTSKSSPKTIQSTTIESESPPETNNNVKKSRKNTSSENPLIAANIAEILNRCESELVEAKEKKKKQKSENVEDDERLLEKKEKKKLKKAEKQAARAAIEEKRRQQLEDAAERKKQKKVESERPSTSTSAVLNSASNSAQSSGKRLRKKRDESPECVDSAQPNAKKVKHLKILTASGEFKVEPMTPPVFQFGFKEEPRMLTPRTFKVQALPKNTAPVQHVLNAKKRRRVDDSEDSDTLLSKPKWHVQKLFDRFEQKHDKKRQRESNEFQTIHTASTKYIVQPLETKGKRRKQPSSLLIPVELMEYRKQNLYKKGIPRQDARTLLKNKEKIAIIKRM